MFKVLDVYTLGVILTSNNPVEQASIVQSLFFYWRSLSDVIDDAGSVRASQVLWWFQGGKKILLAVQTTHNPLETCLWSHSGSQSTIADHNSPDCQRWKQASSQQPRSDGQCRVTAKFAWGLLLSFHGFSTVPGREVFACFPFPLSQSEFTDFFLLDVAEGQIRKQCEICKILLPVVFLGEDSTSQIQYDRQRNRIRTWNFSSLI